MNSRRPVERTVLFMALPLFALLLTGGLLALCGNNPWPKGLSDSNCMFSSMGVALKTLDPSTAYYEHEGAILDNIVEPLFEYHYLKRPYELKPLLAEEMPAPKYFGKDGRRLPDDAADGDIARVEYIVKLRSGVLYQPHPCFAKDASGRHLYIGEDAAIPRCQTPNDFAEKGGGLQGGHRASLRPSGGLSRLFDLQQLHRGDGCLLRRTGKTERRTQRLQESSA